VSELDASVLVPLMDDRATGERCIRAWTRGQTYPRDRYEVIALAPGVDPELEEGIRPLLTGRDHWVVEDLPIVVGLLNVGARRARGRILFLTEAHVEPDAECLAELMRHLEESGDPGARGASVGRAKGSLGELEKTSYLEAFERTEESAEPWNRVLIHSFAIQRDVFLGVGGFRPELGDFANHALGVQLYELGVRLGFAAGARVFHTYDGELKGLQWHLRDFGRGQMAYCSSTPPELRERYLAEVADWTDRRAYTSAGARAALRAAAALRHPDAGVLREAGRHLPVALAGPRGALALSWAHVGWRIARLLALRGSGPRRRLAFDNFWRAAARLGRCEWQSANPLPDPGPPEPSDHIDLTAGEDPRLVGFHAVESWEGERFRWTSPLALAEAAPPGGGSYVGRLGLVPMRGDRPLIRVAVDGRPVPHNRSEHAIEFPIEGGARRWIAVAASALRPRREGSPDHRDLGLPVTSLSFERTS
jgi:hypothetical protein